MSAQVTEAHLELAKTVIFSRDSTGRLLTAPMGAQFIADSEAKATAQANAQVESLISSVKNAIPDSEHPAEPTVENWAWQIRNLGDDRRLVYNERDQLRAECNNLRADLDAIKAIRNEETARAERAEREVKRLTAACDKFSNDEITQGDWKARAERAEALLGKLQELHGCSQEMVVHWCEHATKRSLGLDQAQAELAAERARIADLVADLNDACITLTSAEEDCDDYAMQNTRFKLMAVREVLLQHIPNAAMKEDRT